MHTQTRLTDYFGRDLADTDNASHADTNNASLADTSNASHADTNNASLADTNNASLADTDNASLADTSNASHAGTNHASLAGTDNASLADGIESAPPVVENNNAEVQGGFDSLEEARRPLHQFLQRHRRHVRFVPCRPQRLNRGRNNPVMFYNHFPRTLPARAPSAPRPPSLPLYPRSRVEGSPLPPPHTPLAYAGTAHALQSNNPYLQRSSAAQMANNPQPSAGPVAAEPTSTHHAMQGGQASHLNAKENLASNLGVGGERWRLPHNGQSRVSRSRKRGGVGTRRFSVAKRLHEHLTNLNKRSDDQVQSNRGSLGDASCQCANAQDSTPLGQARSFTNEGINQLRAEKAAQQQGKKDEEESKEPACTTESEEE